MHEVQRSLLTSDECLWMPGPKKSNSDLITGTGIWLSIVQVFRPSTVANPFTFKTQPLQRAPRFRHQSIATHGRMCRCRISKSIKDYLVLEQTVGVRFAHVGARCFFRFVNVCAIVVRFPPLPERWGLSKRSHVVSCKMH